MGIIEIVMTLGMLVLLQAVLGFDNLLYISLESKRAPESKQSSVRKWGIGIAVGLRVILLLLLIKMISSFQTGSRVVFLTFDRRSNVVPATLSLT